MCLIELLRLPFFLGMVWVISREQVPWQFKVMAAVIGFAPAWISVQSTIEAEEHGGKWFDNPPHPVSAYVRRYLIGVLCLGTLGAVLSAGVLLVEEHGVPVWLRWTFGVAFVIFMILAMFSPLLEALAQRKNFRVVDGICLPEPSARRADRMKSNARAWRLAAPWMILPAIAIVALWAITVGSLGWKSVPIALLIPVVWKLCLIGYRSFLGRSRRVEQRRALFLALNDGRPFFLLLRSFSDSELFDAAPEPNALADGPDFVVISDLAQDLRQGLDDEGAIVTLDHRVLSYREDWTLKLDAGTSGWEATVADAIQHCLGVLVLPGTSRGVLREMEMLRSDALDQVLVIMPPTERWAWYSGQEHVRRTKWTEVAKDLQSRGYHLPDYDLKGLIYLPNSDYSVLRSEPIYDLRHIGLAVARLAESVVGAQHARGDSIQESLADFVRYASRRRDLYQIPELRKSGL